MRDHNIINPDIDKLQFRNTNIYFDWTQEQKLSIIQYITKHGIRTNPFSLDGGHTTIQVNGTHYSIFYSTRHIGFPCSITKSDFSDHKPDWKEIVAAKHEQNLKWDRQHLDAQMKRRYLKLVNKEDVPVCPIQAPTDMIFYMNFKFKDESE